MGGFIMARIAKLVPKTVDLHKVLDEFLLFKAGDGAAKRTLEDYAYHVNRFLNRSPGIHDYQALQEAVYRYFAEETAPATRNIRLKYLRAFFSWCLTQGYLPANPTAGIKRAREDLDNVRHVTLEAIKKLLAAPDKKTYAGLRDYCFMLVQMDTGARPGELFQVKVQDLNLEAREIRIRPEASKTRMGRTLPISPYTAQALAKFLKARPEWWGEDVPLFATETGGSLNRHHWARRLRGYCEKAGVKVTPYGLRHSFAISFLKASNDPFALQRMLGHKDLTMTRRYVRLTQAEVREAHEKASPVTKLTQLEKRAGRRLH